MSRGLDHFRSLGPSIKLSMGPSLLASAVFHVLSLGGIWGGYHLWQENVTLLSGNNQMNPMSIEFIYEENREGRECKKKAPQSSLKGKICPDSVSENIVQNHVVTFPQHNKTLEYSFDQSTKNYSAEHKDAIVITPSPGNEKLLYPPRAQEEKIEGTVILRLIIGPSGQVLKATPLEPRAHPVLEKSTLDTVYRHTYIISGSARTIIRDCPFEFRLTD